MLPQNPLLQLTPPRAKAALARIRSQVWGAPEALTVQFAGSSTEHASLAEAKKRKLRPADTPFFWGKLEDQAWFRITIPKSKQDGTWHLEWKEQGESTAYIDGVPYAGLDVAHTTCPIPKGCKEIWMEAMALETGIWMSLIDRPAITPEGCRFESANSKQRDEQTWEVLHSFEVLLDLLKSEYGRNPSLRTPFGREIGYNSPLEDVSPLYRKLVRLIENATCAYESGGIAGCRKSLRVAYKELKGHSEMLKCRLTGHAHIDLVWLWTEKAAEFKAVHTFATANRLMGEYPEFRFGYSQPASYRAVERRSPKLMQAVRKRIASKQWEALGAAEVESDTLLACGEALARSLMIGQEGFRELQGKDSEIMWLPDVFGYSACLPQILEQTGVKYFFTTKLHWGSVSLFPYSSFIWQGSDGTEILSHVSQGMGYNMNVTPSEIRNAVRDYRQADVHDEILMACGYGDGGGGVTEEMCERARRLSDLAGTPSSKWGRIDGFFEGLEETRKELPAYKGELYLQYHRGVLTTHGDLKDSFRKAERSLQTWEAAQCATGGNEIDIEAWRRMVFAQFHDYIPGSSIPEVYDEALPELKSISENALDSAKRALSKRGKKECIFNPLPLKRTVLHQNKLVELAPLCGTPTDELKQVESTPVVATRSSLSNGRVSAKFDANGRIRQLTVDGKEIAQSGPLGQLMLYPDQPHAFEAWDIDRSTLSMGTEVKGARLLTCVSAQTSGKLSYKVQITEQSSATIHYTLTAGSTALQIEYEIDWNDPEHLLKVIFPTDYNGAQARFGDPFGSSLRSQQPGKAYDEAQWEVAGSRYAIVSDDGESEGLYVVSEAKYGWTARSGSLGLSLLRSAKMPTSARASVEGEGNAQAIFSDLKGHRIRIAVGLFNPSAPREEMPAALADSLYTEHFVYSGKPSDAGFLGLNGGESLLPCWAKPEADGTWTLRLHETLGRRGSAELLLAEGYEFIRTDLRGDLKKPKPKGARFTFKSYELVSLRIQKTKA